MTTVNKHRLSRLIETCSTLFAFALALYSIMTLWQPPLPHTYSRLLHYGTVPAADLLTITTIAVNLIHQHGNLFNWAFPPAPYLFPDLLLCLIIALFCKNILAVVFVFGLIQAVYFVFSSYLLNRMISHNHKEAGRLTLLFLLFALWLLCYPQLLSTFGTINAMLVPSIHFGVTIMTLTLLPILIMLLRSTTPLLLLLFIPLFILTTISDLLFLAYFAAPAIVALLLSKLTTPMQRNRMLALALLSILSILSWLIYQRLPIFIHRLSTPITFHRYYLTHLVMLLATFFRHSPILASMWLLFAVFAPLSWLHTYRKPNNHYHTIDFVTRFLFLQIIIGLFALIPVNGLLQELPFNPSMRYLQPMITLPTVIGLPLLLYKHAAPLNRLIHSTPLYCTVLLALALSTVINKPALNLNKKIDVYPADIACLDRHANELGLHNGIVDYFDYYTLSQFNRSGISVALGEAGKTVIYKNYWNSRLDDYRNKKFDFVVTTTLQINNEMARQTWLSPENVRRIIGPPETTFSCGPLYVYVYRHGEINHAFHSKDTLGHPLPQAGEE